MTQEQTPQTKQIRLIDLPDSITAYSRRFLKTAPEKLIREKIDLFAREDRKQSEILYLKYIEGRSLAWIANKLNYSTGWHYHIHLAALNNFYKYLPNEYR